MEISFSFSLPSTCCGFFLNFPIGRLVFDKSSTIPWHPVWNAVTSSIRCSGGEKVISTYSGIIRFSDLPSSGEFSSYNLVMWKQALSFSWTVNSFVFFYAVLFFGSLRHILIVLSPSSWKLLLLFSYPFSC